MDKRIKEIERAELHAHLGSSVPVEVLWELSHEQGIRLPVHNYDDFEEMITMWKLDINKDLVEMDAKYFKWTELIQSSPFAMREAVRHTIWINYRKSNLVLQELRVNPMNRNKWGELDLDYLMISAIHWLDKALLQYSKVRAWIILCMDRRFTVEQNTILLEKAIKYKNRGVIGIDIAWPLVESFSIKDYKTIFAIAKWAGLWTTIHTWEEWNLDELRYVVEEIKPDRIWHWIMAVQDKKIMEKISNQNIILEICPTSNLKNSKLPDIKALKKTIRTLLDNDIKLTLNTDWAVMYNINIVKEEEFLLENDIVTEKEIRQMYKNAFEYTFIK
jgi:adenosine deaminase